MFLIYNQLTLIPFNLNNSKVSIYLSKDISMPSSSIILSNLYMPFSDSITLYPTVSKIQEYQVFYLLAKLR